MKDNTIVLDGIGKELICGVTNNFVRL